MKYIALLFVGVSLLFSGCAQSEVETAEDQTGDGVNANDFYELRVYKAEPGKLDDLNTRFRDHTMEIFEKHGMKNIGYWVPIENTDNLLYYVLSYPSREARDASWEAFNSDPEWIEAKNASVVDGPLVSGVESLFLSTTDYSPVISPSVAENPRTFELRTYTSTPGNLNNLHTRFRDHTIDLFSKHGMEHFGYWSPVEADQGSDNTLVYFIFHKDVESRDASFDGFRTDPDWTAAFEASVENAGGSLAENVESILMKPTDYSPTK